MVGGRAATRGVRLMTSRCNARCYGGGWRQIYDPAVERERKELGVGLVARVATSEHFHWLESAEAPAVENDVTVLPLLEISAHLLSFFFSLSAHTSVYSLHLTNTVHLEIYRYITNSRKYPCYS